MFPELWELGQLASIVTPEHAGLKASYKCVLHLQTAGRGARALPSQARMGQSCSDITNGSIMLPHCDHLNFTTCKTKLLDNIGEGMGSIGGQAEAGCVCREWLKIRSSPWQLPVVILGQNQHPACTSKMDCSCFTDTLLELSCPF
eukprot:1158327-Pelagomonas_calceolata.AAC.3